MVHVLLALATRSPGLADSTPRDVKLSLLRFAEDMQLACRLLVPDKGKNCLHEAWVGRVIGLAVDKPLLHACKLFQIFDLEFECCTLAFTSVPSRRARTVLPYYLRLYVSDE